MKEPPKLLEAVKEVAPKLVELTENLVYGDIWKRSGLSLRDRSLITMAALIVLPRPSQLKPHIKRALANGVTREEISEMITHLAIYGGWPLAVVASEVAAEVFMEQDVT